LSSRSTVDLRSRPALAGLDAMAQSLGNIGGIARWTLRTDEVSWLRFGQETQPWRAATAPWATTI
jgi:hypothetical protein